MTERGGGGEVFVIDTSSVIEVRRLMSQERTTNVTAVYTQLIRLAKAETLRFPKGVIDEIKAGASAITRGPDQANDWAIACERDAVPHHELLDETKHVLAEVPDLLDAHKPSSTDEADPYVVALALKLTNAGMTVTVITDERRDTPDKTSMGSACGVMRIPAVSMRVFLARRRIWPAPA